MSAPSLAILIERLEHVPLALEVKRRQGDRGQLVALAPSVMVALERAGEEFAVPEDYLPARDLKALGLASYARLEALGDWIAGKWPDDLVDPNPIWVHYFWLKLLVDSVGIPVRQLARVLAGRERACVFRASGDDLWTPRHRYEFVAHQGPVYSTVAPLVASALGAACEVVHTPPLAAASPRWRGSWNEWRIGVADSVAMVTALARNGGRTVAVRYGGLRHDMPALVAAAAQGSSRRLVPLEAWNGHVGAVAAYVLGARPSDRTLRARARAVWTATEAELARQPLFATFGTDIFPLVGAAFRDVLTDGVVERARRTRVARALARRATFALATFSGRFEHAVLSLAFRAEDKPVVYAQEGGLYGYCSLPTHHYCELSLGSHFLSYGQPIADYLSRTRLTRRQSASVVAAGSARLKVAAAASSGRRPARVRRVLYAPTNDFTHCVTYSPLCFSDRAYYRLKRKVLEALLAIDGIEVLYKPPQGTLGRDSCRELVASHADRILAIDAPVEEVRDRADLFVLDWPATVLLDVLTTERPVVAFFSEDVMDVVPEAIALLARRAFVSRTEEAFLADIVRAVGGAVGPDPSDRAFLDAYGTGGPTAWSRDRTAQFFAGLCR